MNAALINPFTDSTAIQPPAVEQPATASLTLPAEGAVAEPSQLGAIAAETAATDPGRAVAATLSHNKITQAVEIQSLGVVVDRGTTQRLEIGSLNAGYFSGPTASGAVWHGENGCSDPAPPCDLTRPSQFNTALPVSSEPSLPADAPTAQVSAGFSYDDLERLLGVAEKRRPLALPPFAPDFPALWKAMHDKTAPRTVLDPLWADASPLFLRDAS